MNGKVEKGLGNSIENNPLFLLTHRLVGLVVKASASRAEDPVYDGIFPGSSHTSDLQIGTQVLPCQAPDVVGSVLGLVGPVSVYCD